MEFIGKLQKKLVECEGDGKNGHWKLAEYLLETVEMMPKKMYVTVMDGEIGRIKQWDELIGEDVIAQFEVWAEEYNGRWYNRIRAWGIRSTKPLPPKEEEGPTFGRSKGMS